MKRWTFTKMHGAGNDFVVLDGIRAPVRMTSALARKLCDRRFGVGADQVLVLAPSKTADAKMLIYNADGSEVEMCGNGIRCVARFARARGHVKKNAMTVETRAGLRRAVVQRGGVRVDMGAPILDAAQVPTTTRGRVIEKSLTIRPAHGKSVQLKITAVSMGNPHAVIFVPDVDRVPLEIWGPLLERHPFFPRRTNVEFVQEQSPDRARVRVWERGSGATLACGTGACAVGVAGVLTGRFHRRVTLSLPGGDLGVEWAADNRVLLSGPAAFVYEGIFAA